jgi:MFS transporter, PAT family, beta-lactamase induction signal transducer AmpG
MIKQILSNRKFADIFLLSILSGMPLSIIFSTISAWLKDGGVAIEVITTFAIARLPYSLKFLWSPVVDYIKIPIIHKLGHRKSWMILCSSIMTVTLFFISYVDIHNQLGYLYILAIILGIASATYDIVFDAFRIEDLEVDEQGTGAATTTFGYRIGMLITGAISLEIAHVTDSWHITFISLGAIFALFTLYIFIVREKDIIREKINNLSISTVSSLLVNPFRDFLTREGAMLILIAVILFKMGDAMLGAIAMPFYLDLGFSKHQIAVVVKGFGLFATIFGGYLGGIIIDKVGPFKGLIITGIVQSLTHFAFIWLYYQADNNNALLAAITIENMGAGIGASALIAYVSMLCNKKYSATQYAMLSSAASFFNNTITIYAGQLVKMMGWVDYFLFTIVLALPALLLLTYLNKKFPLVTSSKL